MSFANTIRIIARATRTAGRRWGAVAGRALAVSACVASAAPSALAAGKAKAPPAHHAAPPAPHAPAAPHAANHARNPHLHGFEFHNDLHRLHEHWWVHHWYYVGDYHTWFTAHTGLGIIQGDVVSGTGSPIPGASVWLRKGNGHPFGKRSRKHITHADSQGNFVMYGVIPGTYTVVGRVHKSGARARVHVDPGSAVTAEIHFPHMEF